MVLFAMPHPRYGDYPSLRVGLQPGMPYFLPESIQNRRYFEGKINMNRKFLAGLAGVVTSLVFIALIESASHLLYAGDEMPDTHDPKVIAAYVAAMPLGAFLSVLLAYVAGTFVGGWTACKVAGEKPRLYAGIVGGFVLLFAAANFAMIPHPDWFKASCVIAIPIAAWLASLVGKPKPAAAEQ